MMVVSVCTWMHWCQRVLWPFYKRPWWCVDVIELLVKSEISIITIYRSRIWGAETPKPIATKFCMPSAVQDLITRINFGEDRLRGFGVVRGQIVAFSTDLFVVVKTLSHYRASVW